MTSPHQILESEALDEVERRLVAQGYTVIRDPDQAVLPDFLEHFQADAIATGKSPNLLIEVIARRGSGGAAVAKIDQLNSLLKGHADWRLEVVYLTPSSPDPSVVPAAVIRLRLAEIRQLADVDERAALIVAWSLLEAVARALRPDRAGRALTPASTIELLTSLGYIVQSEADMLRQAGRARNLIVHGDLTAAFPRAALAPVLDLIDQLVGVLERSAGEAGGGSDEP